MTRQEATKIIRNNYGSDLRTADQLRNALEALGLIKFEEEKKYGLTDVLYDARLCCINDSSISQKQFIDYLAKRGYKIVKTGVNTTVVIEACVEVQSSAVGRTYNGKLLKIEQS